MTERHSRHSSPLQSDDTIADGFAPWLARRPRALGHPAVLTRSIERPAVRAGVECPRCSGSMFLERQIGSEPELVCQSCSYSEVTVALPALLELAGEMEVKEAEHKKPGGWTRHHQPKRYGARL